MPQDKLRQQSVARSTKTPSRTDAKNDASVPLKRKGPGTAPAVKREALNAVGEPVKHKPKADQSVSDKPANKNKPKAAARPVKEPRKHAATKAKQSTAALSTAKPENDPHPAPIASLTTADEQRPPIESKAEHGTAGIEAADRSDAPVATPIAAPFAPQPASSKRLIERRTVNKSVAERRQVDPFARERRRADPSALPLTVPEPRLAKIALPAAIPAAIPPASEKEPEPSEQAASPNVERRKTIRSLFERRLADPSAKERRKADSLGSDATILPSITVSPVKQRTKEIPPAVDLPPAKGNPANDIRDAAKAAEPAATRTPSDWNPGWAGEPLETTFAVSEQRNMLNETAQWMRRSGAVLIGLNALVILGLLFVWRSHSSQQAQIKELQKVNSAAMEQMAKTTTAWEGAAYASCLRIQAAQSILTQIRMSGTRFSPASAPAQSAATRAQAAQIELHTEKAAGLSAHMPVLFHLGIDNIGKSSALNAKVWGEVKVLDSNQEPRFRYGPVDSIKEAIAPTDAETTLVLYTTNAGLVAPLTEDQYRRIDAGSAYVVAYGKVEYDDVYGAHHWAVFCHAITEPVGAGTRFRRCQAYNNAGVREAAVRPVSVPVAPGAPIDTASLTKPEIACQISRQQKN